MKTTTDKTIEVLNSLIECNCDAAEGFGAAAKDADRPELRELFQRLSTQRRDFAQELRSCVARMGEEPEDSGSLSGAAHRGWMKLREALSSKDNHVILSECERGEDRAVEAYREALAELVDPQACEIVRRQANEVQRGHDKVRDLRDSPAYRKN